MGRHLRSGDVGLEAPERELLVAVPDARDPLALALQPRDAPERQARLPALHPCSHPPLAKSKKLLQFQPANASR